MVTVDKSLGQFRLDRIPAAPRCIAQIEVEFAVDANGILSVTANDKGSSKEQSITISGVSTLSDSDLEQLVKGAEANEEADKAKRELIHRKNQTEALTDQRQKQVDELENDVTPELKTKVELVIGELKQALQEDDSTKIKAGLEALQTALMEMGLSVYQSQKQPPTTGSSKEPIDAEVIDV